MAITQSKDLISWWQFSNLDHAILSRGSVEQVAIFSLHTMAIKNNLCVYDFKIDGNMVGEASSFLHEINKLGGHCISKTLDKNVNIHEYVITWSDAILTASFEEAEWAYIKISSLNQELVNNVKLIAERFITDKSPGKAYMFVSGENGPELRQLHGKAGVAIEKENYSSKVMADFEHVIKDLQSETPCGRLIIIDGPAGCGKTHLIRGITDAITGAMFIIVPPSMIPDMMSPQFIPVLMDHHKNKQPIVFIIEDADACLIERGADNLNTISALLNLGDGIFGSMFNIKIMATTNAKRIDIDPAILRKGRCCRYIEVNELPKEQAEKVLRRLTKDQSKKIGNQEFYTLGDVYNFARDDSGEIEIKKKDVGFNV